METIKKLIEEKKQNYSELVSHPNFEKRIRWELIEIDVQDEEQYFLDLVSENKKLDNPHNLLVPVLLGICDKVDLDKDPAYKFGDFPDVDVDYLPIVRDYLKNEWAPREFGADNVCSIGNYGTFGLKSSLIDMVRVHGLDRGEMLAITTRMGLKDDDGQALTLDKALEMYPDLKQYLQNRPEIEVAVRKLLHRNRSMGKHAGGLIICNNRIDNFVPLVRGTDGNPVSAWVEGLHGQDLGPVGLIKFDLLVVDGLYQIALATKMVKERHKLDSLCALPGDWDWSDVVYLNDPASLEMANNGDMRCIFQFDSDGIRSLVMKGGVSHFDDLVAYVSLYRPSALDVKMDEEYILRKRGKKEYEIPDILKPHLSNSYGVLIYQENIMQVLSIVGKIPMRDCYQVIKAISKKKLSAFIKYKDKFIENGQQTLGWTKKQMEEYWQLIEAFSGYGFNKTLTEDTIIYCVDSYKQIKDIRAGDKVYCVNEKGEQAQTEVIAVHDHGVIDVVEVTFDDGYSVKCTLDHKFLTEEGQVPLWKIIRDNLTVLSSPLGEQNAEETKLGSKLRRSVQQQKKNYRTSSKLHKKQRDIFAKENRKTQSQSSLWSKVSNQIQISRTSKGMSGLHLFKMAGDRKEVHISMRDRISSITTISRTSSSLREMHGNKKEEYSGSHGQIEQRQPCSRTQSDILCNCQKDFGKEGCAGSKVGTTEKMEGQKSRGICKEYRESTALSKEIENGNVVKTISWMETEENKMWEKQEICGLGEEEDLDRGRRAISFLANWISTEQAWSQFRIRSSQRSNAQGRMFEKRRYDSVETEYEMFSQQNRGNEEGVVGFTPDYAPITNTRNLVHRRVLRVVPVGKRQCYDLEVAVSTHNFILPNGVVTSNSHATSYSYLSSRQLYLKSHYPIEFFTSSLINQDNDDKKREYITEAINHGVEVCELDINKSKETFSIVDEKIYIGFSNIKGIGEEKAKKIVETQPYISFQDFLDRYGTEANVVKALLGLRVFKEADPIILYKFWEKYTEYKKQVKDREKRFEATRSGMLQDMCDILPEDMRRALSKFPALTKEIMSKVIEYVEKRGLDELKGICAGIKKKLDASYTRFETNGKKVIPPNFDTCCGKEVEIDDEKMIPLLKSKDKADIAFYGFIWENKVKQLKDYKPGFNWEQVKFKAINRPMSFYSVMGFITQVHVQSMKNGGKFANVSLADDNFEENKVVFWDEDRERFQEELKAGNCISIQVVPSNNGRPGYVFYGPPKHQRYKLPKKNLDYRLIVLES